MTVAQLQELTAVERELFTSEHDSWANPGIAISPTGLYEIRTICGFETLLGVAETVEDHHRRLAAWNGVDPFVDGRGIVRVEPGYDGVETNGVPYWWAAGFQRGDLTVLRFAWGSIEGLGHTLTHELTHRFDGRIRPFLPAWLSEGRAVWADVSYGRVTDARFFEDYLSPYKVQDPYVKGYGGTVNLTKLLEGTVDDYRDNYTAGYALFVYLQTWATTDGFRLFSERLQQYMANARAGQKDPVGFFTKTFADGKDGRPDGLSAFAKSFGEFMHQCYRWSWGENDRDAANAWIRERYTLGFERTSEWHDRVMDPPTLSWAQGRAEPWFGQAHLLAAAQLLTEVGDHKGAAAAACWSLQVDGWREDNALLAADALTAIGDRDAAHAVRQLAAHRTPTLAAPAGRAPHAGKLPKLLALQKALRDAADVRGKAGLVLAAAAAAERHDRLAMRLGTEHLRRTVPANHVSVYPNSDNPHALGVSGWVEDGLTDYEDRRVVDL